jgi:hypothetical protein
MKSQLTINEALTEDIKLLTTEELFKKAASYSIPMNDLFGLLSKALREMYQTNYRTAAFKRSLRILLEEHAPMFTAKEMSFLTNHTLGTLILEDKLFKKQ